MVWGGMCLPGQSRACKHPVYRVPQQTRLGALSPSAYSTEQLGLKHILVAYTKVQAQRVRLRAWSPNVVQLRRALARAQHDPFAG